MFSLEQVSLTLGAIPLLHEVTLHFSHPQLVILIGPNGAGKSTLLQVMAGLKSPTHGVVRWQGKDVKSYAPQEWGRQRGWFAQMQTLSFPLCAQEVVAIGASLRNDWTQEQREQQIENAMRTFDCWHLAARDYRLLSGGERQRVHLARVWVQIAPTSDESRLLLLDEPLNNLDLAHQRHLLCFAQTLARQHLVIMALHDLSLALRYGERIIALKQGSIFADVPVQAVSSHLLEKLYNIEISIDPWWGIRWH